jgi:hypothetical protein
MRRSLAVTVAAVASVALTATVPAEAKPCSGETSVPMLEEMLPRVRAALDLPGTDQVGIDESRRCIAVQVRTTGTARLVKLMLRGLDVPREAVDLRVVEVKPVRGT